MLKNYLKTTFRILRKKPTYNFLNIAGLAIGVASAALIFLWVEDELGFDHQFRKRNELSLIRMNINYSGKIINYDAVPGPMSNTIKGQIPGVQNTSRIWNESKPLFTLGEKSIYENGAYVDTGFFSMMLLPFVKGDPASVFNQLHALVLTEKMARKFFGEADPIGKTLKMNNEQDYIITGIIRDLPANISFHFDWLAPLDNFLASNTWLDLWSNFGIRTLVELQPGTSLSKINSELTAILRPKDKGYAHADCFLWSMNDWHLYDQFTNGIPDGGQIKFVKLFSLIAWIILIIACINFMNLATARAGQRSKEVGVRKALGALKRELISQFIAYSLISSFISVLLAILLVTIFLPGFNILVDKQLQFDLFDPIHLTGLLAIGLICGLLAGSYPAFYLSSFDPIASLKGLRINIRARAGFIRKALVISQFSISVFLIICTIVIYQQVRHIRNRDIGYNKQNLLYTDLQGSMRDHFGAIKADLLKTGLVENATMSFSPPLQMWSATNSSLMSWEGNDPNYKVNVNQELISPEYVSTMGLTLKEGRDLYKDKAANNHSVLINEAMAKLMGKSGRIGSVVRQDSFKFEVVGILKDFVFNNMYGSTSPLFLHIMPQYYSYLHILTIRLKPGADLKTALTKIEAAIKSNNPGYPFEYRFADEEFNKLFKTEGRIGKLAGLFAVLAIFISCLGLFGLAAYTSERRTKEIGIRKVLGASASGIVGLLSKEFLLLVGISCFIAFPLAWWAMNKWLQDYEYRTTIYWWIFGLAGLSALSIALITVSFQAIKAALTNPVKSLRTE